MKSAGSVSVDTLQSVYTEIIASSAGIPQWISTIAIAAGKYQLKKMSRRYGLNL